MSRSLYDAVDRYIEALFVPADPVLEEALSSARAAGLPHIEVSAANGKLLYLMARLCNARRILEVGTLGGYSSIWMGRALPADGRLVTLEIDPAHAAVARENLARAGLDAKVEVVVGPAIESLNRMVAEGEGAFDMVFLDADKAGYPAYLDRILRLTRPGGLILADNVVRAGAVLDPDSSGEGAVGADVFNRKLAADQRVEAVVIQQVGLKGHDGLAIARVKG
jgi:predicted O-methyltransferase YrrM